jgi:hypothetical protein
VNEEQHISANLLEQQPNQAPTSENRVVERPARTIETRQREPFLSLYANNIFIRTTPWDIQPTFGEILSIDQQKVVIENQLAVNLSPQQAKSLLDLLSGQIQAYERQYGEIRYTPLQPQTEEPST